MVRVMTIYGPGVLNCRIAAARGSAIEKISPRKIQRMLNCHRQQSFKFTLVIDSSVWTFMWTVVVCPRACIV